MYFIFIQVRSLLLFFPVDLDQKREREELEKKRISSKSFRDCGQEEAGDWLLGVDLSGNIEHKSKFFRTNGVALSSREQKGLQTPSSSVVSRPSI